ncbi:MAG: S1C family serine protease [Ilumatobacteraceae bacterium]
MRLPRRALSLVAGCALVASCGTTAAPPTDPATSPDRLTDASVQIIADGCSQVEVHGAGLMVAKGRIATVAHVVAGAKRIDVRGTHGTSEATVVYFDPVLDVAVLKVDPSLGSPIAIGTASRGDHGRAIVYRDGAPVELAAGIQRLVDIRTADIYGEGTHIRPGYELTIDIQAGDSGSVVVVDDTAVALVWAVSRQAESRAWAMRTSLVADHLANDAAVDNGECA